jgi:hypothetical protein
VAPVLDCLSLPAKSTRLSLPTRMWPSFCMRSCVAERGGGGSRSVRRQVLANGMRKAPPTFSLRCAARARHATCMTPAPFHTRQSEKVKRKNTIAVQQMPWLHSTSSREDHLYTGITLLTYTEAIVTNPIHVTTSHTSSTDFES